MLNKIFKQTYLRAGFTLVELVVVIGIIAIISVFIIVSLTTGRVRARDSKRIADLNQLRTALNNYFDNNSHYPYVPDWVFSTSGGNWIPGLTPTFMNQIPVDPKNNTTQPWINGNYSYAYYSTSNYQNNYDLVAQLEDTSSDQRCAVKCWAWHTQGSETSWCSGAGTSCTSSNNNSPYLYADH